jgi:hypothetical protein
MSTEVGAETSHSLIDAGIDEASLRTLAMSLLGNQFSSSTIEINAEDVTNEAIRRQDILERELREYASRVIRARQAVPRRLLIYPAAAGLALVVFGGGFILMAMTINWPWNMARYHSWWPAVVVAMIFILLVVSATLPESIAARRRSFIQYDAANAEFQGRLKTALESLLRAIINEKTADVAASGDTIFYSEAPALVELESAEQPVPSHNYQQLVAFVRDHQTSAIGIAGPRGAGKTTIMKALLKDESLDAIGVYIAAPVSYGAADFVRLLQQQLAEGVLRREKLPIGGPPRMPFAKPIHVARLVAATSKWAWLFLIAVLIIAVDNLEGWKSKFSVDPLTLAAAMAAAVALAALVRQMQAQLAKSRRPSRLSPEARLSYDYLDQLNWESAYQRTVKAGAKVASSVSAEGTSQVTHSERLRSHPENVANLRHFLRQLHQITDQPVIVCIDEMDKMSEGGGAVEFVNGLKDLFHITGTHFVLSVSTDATHRFAARGVPLRDVFDSSLDTVFHVGRLSFDESRALLDRRVLYFPDSAVLFCHCWAGGHARDLIRAARAMVEAKRVTPGPVPIVDLVPVVMRCDIAETVSAAYEGLSSSEATTGFVGLEQADIRSALVALLREIEKDEKTIHDAISACLDELIEAMRTHFVPESQLLYVLPTYLRLAKVVSRIFSVPRGPSEWRAEIEAKEIIAQVETLAKARWLLAIRPLETADLLMSFERTPTTGAAQTSITD